MLRFLFILFFNLSAFILIGQNLTIDGYVYESGNRGFLNVVHVDVTDDNGTILGSAFTDLTGHFEVEVPVRANYRLVTSKEMFDELETKVSAAGKTAGDKVFIKVEMKRSPGYIFEITLAENREDEEVPVDAIKGARIEVYNNTTGQEILALVDHPEPHFDVALLKGNHYTILVRKDGYLSKRMEAFVDVEGCILCFEGIGSVGPGVSDNLSEGNEMGVLLANVEMDKIYEGKTLPINNIIYEYTKANLDKNDQDGLMALATLMKDNPDLTVEIGSHTDSRGREERNMELSQARAKNVVDFLVDHDVDKSRLFSRGYGETQLKNKCTSFVECTEAEHRINRRTELKVLGIAAVKAPIKTLAQIKQMENAEKLLEEIQFGGQMKIPDPNAPAAKAVKEEVKEEIEEAVRKVNLDDVQGAAMSSPMIGDNATPESIKKLVENATKSDANESTINDQVEVSKETITKEVIEVEAPTETLSEVLQTEKVNLEEESGTSVVELPVLNPMKTSYAIAIKESTEPLAETDDLYSRHSNLNVMRQEDTYFYTIGDFDNIDDAEDFYKTVKLAYPEATFLKIVDEMIVK